MRPASNAVSEQLWRQFETQLERFVRARVSDSHAAEDVLQEIFLKLHTKAGTVLDGEHVTGWVFTVARNAVTDHYRSTARRRERPSDDIGSTQPAEPADEAPSDAQETRQCLLSCLGLALHDLSEEQREAVELVDLGGLTHHQAASMVGISESGMKSRVQRARRSLAATYRRWGELSLDVRGSPVGCEPRPGSPASDLAGAEIAQQGLPDGSLGAGAGLGRL